MKTLAVSLLVITFMSHLFAKEIDKNFHQEYDVQEGASLNLEHGDGNVDVTTWSKDVVDIDVVYRATFNGITRLEPQDFEVEFEKRGDQITVIGREPNIIGIGAHRVHKYQYTIKAPAYVSLNVRGVDGNVMVEGRDNDVKIHSVDGNIVVSDVTASIVDIESIDGNLALSDINTDVNAEAVDGNINIENVDNSKCFCKSIDGNITIDGGSGNFEAGAVDGNIKLLKIGAESVDAHTSDGRIELELEKSEAPDVRLKSGDGNVRVTLANGTSVKINVHTGDGRIRTDLSPVDDLDTDDDMFRGSINGGNGSLSIRTGDGSVSINEE